MSSRDGDGDRISSPYGMRGGVSPRSRCWPWSRRSSRHTAHVRRLSSPSSLDRDDGAERSSAAHRRSRASVACIRFAAQANAGVQVLITCSAPHAVRLAQRGRPPWERAPTMRAPLSDCSSDDTACGGCRGRRFEETVARREGAAASLRTAHRRARARRPPSATPRRPRPPTRSSSISSVRRWPRCSTPVWRR